MRVASSLAMLEKVAGIGALGFALSLGLGCGGNTESGSGAAGGSGGGGGTTGGSGGIGPFGGTGGIDCSTVGCAPPAACGQCTAACGCCSCGEGDLIQQTDGGSMICQGGCYVPLDSKPCGGIAGIQCAADEWCDLPEGCGFPDAMGVCKKRPQGCTADCPGVCGCDGKFYCNACSANAQGLDTGNDTSCSPGDGGTGTGCQSDWDCQTGLKCCYPCGIPGCSNSCMAPDSSGECPMFP